MDGEMFKTLQSGAPFYSIPKSKLITYLLIRLITLYYVAAKICVLCTVCLYTSNPFQTCEYLDGLINGSVVNYWEQLGNVEVRLGKSSKYATWKSIKIWFFIMPSSNGSNSRMATHARQTQFQGPDWELGCEPWSVRHVLWPSFGLVFESPLGCFALIKSQLKVKSFWSPWLFIHD